MESAAKARRRSVYERHVGRLERRLEALAARDGQFFWLRLGTLFGGVALTFTTFSLFGPRAGWGTLAGGVAAFAVVAALHRRLDRARLRFRLAKRLANEALSRMALDWEGIPLHDSEKTSPQHPFGFDLDLTGPHSLHQLLDGTISHGGSERLRAWLLKEVPDAAQALDRQARLRELLPLRGFRHGLTLNGALATEGERWNGEALAAWLAGHAEKKALGRPLGILGAMAALNWVLLALSLAGVLPAWWVVTLAAYGFVYTTQYSALKDLFGTAQGLAVSLERFRAVLLFLERYRYPENSRLGELCAPFRETVTKPSRYLRRISGIASAASLQGNPFVWMVLNAAVPWDLYFAWRLQQYQQALQERLPLWLDRWYELEALVSLANFADWNPDYTFPELAEGGPPFTARQMGHPLIPEATKVRNDFEFHRMGEVAVLTGSNMSGKSTFLRTLGINLALAYCGAPVDAAALCLAPMRLFTSINVSDSLSDGISYFYAEVKRLRALLTELEREAAMPLFFLIDEIFRGTNNRERQIGSRAFVRALAGGNGLGAISTHDLELARLAEEIPGLRNFHFREDVDGGRMVFDYRLREGPSPTTNALRIMELEGLPV